MSRNDFVYGRPIYSIHKHFILLLLMIAPSVGSLLSQQAPGLYDENYSGIHGVMKNPASASHSLLKWDVNLGSANSFFNTDYVFVRETNLFHLLSHKSELTLVDIGSDEPLPEGQLLVDFKEGANSSFFSGLIDIAGPSGFFRMQSWTFGAFTRLRAESSLPFISPNMGYYQFNSLPFNTSFPVESMHGGGLLWGELGLNASKMFLDDGSLSLGLSIKYLIGYEGVYAATDQDFGISRPDDESVSLISPQGILAATSGILDHGNFSLSKKGGGLGVDIGISKVIGKYKLGLSILDIGSISFNQNAELHRLNVTDSITFQYSDLNAQSNLEGLISVVNVTSGDSSLVGTSFKVVLPTRLRVNADLWLNGPWFLNASIEHGLSKGQNGIRAIDNVALTPRFEKRWFAVSMPLIIHNYKTIRMGLSARLGPLVIGSDDLFSLLGKNDFNGSSLYMALKINPFGSGSEIASHSRAVGCPEFPH